MKKFLLASALLIGMTSFSMAQSHRPVHHKRVVHHKRHHVVHHHPKPSPHRHK